MRRVWAGGEESQDHWFVGVAAEHQADARWSLVGELFWQSPDEAGGADEFAATVGTIYEPAGSETAWLFSVSTSLSGWADLRLYIGPRFEFGGD